MGLFNFINYDKEGPGVSKDEPRKKGFIRFFEIYFRNFWKLVTMNLYYCLISVPILTYGLADVGLANVTRSMSREKHSFGTSDFFETIKKNWKQGLVVGIVNLFVTLLLIFDLWYFFPREGDNLVSSIFTGISTFFLFVFTIMKYYMPMLIITFSLKGKQLYKNCFKFVFINFKRNLIIFFSLLLFGVAVVLLALYGGHIGAAVVMVLMVFIYPSFRSLLIQFCIFDAVRKYMIDPYYEEHPDADIDKRLALGLDVPDEYLPKYDDEESVFADERLLPESDAQ